MAEIVAETDVPAAQQPLVDALRQIARGHPTNGTPLNRVKAQQIARAALIAAGLDWTAAGAPR